eukprot:12997949-Alexandrium_andersonii.AAC.1
MEFGPRWMRGSLRRFFPAGSKSEIVVHLGSGLRWRAAVRIEQVLSIRPSIRRRLSRPSWGPPPLGRLDSRKPAAIRAARVEIRN